jgi:hypothetical protein
LEVLVVKPDFNAMTKGELRAYVIAHPDDRTAFHTFVDRFTAEASPELLDIPNSTAGVKEVDILIQQKLAQLKTS